MIRVVQRPREALPEVVVVRWAKREGRERHERGQAECALGRRGCVCLRVACIVGCMHASEVYSTRLELLLPCGTIAAAQPKMELTSSCRFGPGAPLAERRGGGSSAWWQDAVLQQKQRA